MAPHCGTVVGLDPDTSRVNCSRLGPIQGSNASGVGAAVPGYVSNGGPSVFATNVPGIGISVFWCKHPNDCFTDIAQITPLPSLTWQVSVAGTYTLLPKWRVRLIKIGDIGASARALTVGGTSSASYVYFVVGTLTITGSSQVAGQGTCQINANSRSIDVPLPDVAKADFVNSTIPRDNDKAKTFNINLLCDSGVKVSYQVDGAQIPGSGSTFNILANSSAQGMASGVGVILFQGEKNSFNQLELGSKFLHDTTTSSNTQVKIPLTARYFRTAETSSEMGSGLVSSTAFFTLYYE